jgi:LPXTG-motif cell wall-anchored protein
MKNTNLIIGVLVLGFIAWWLMKRRKENTGAIDQRLYD